MVSHLQIQSKKMENGRFRGQDAQGVPREQYAVVRHTEQRERFVPLAPHTAHRSAGVAIFTSRKKEMKKRKQGR
jgi:hypothetical protein